MTIEHEVLSMSEEDSKFVLAVKLPPDKKIRHNIPKVAFVCRAAEYGIDPYDTHTLLDVLLHEGFRTTDNTHPKFVYNTDEETARQHMFDEIEQIKLEHIVTDPNHYLDSIHTNYIPDMSLHTRHISTVQIWRKVGMGL